MRDLPHLADLSGGDDVAGRTVVRLVARHVTDHQQPRGRCRCLDDASRVLERPGEGLLADDVPLGVQRGEGGGSMVLRRRADIHDVDPETEQRIKVCDHLGTMPLGDPPEFGIAADDIVQRRWPTRHDLDRAAPDNPVYIKPAWGYWRPTLPLVSIANTRALELAGITRDTHPPCETVVIDRDARGEPTGRRALPRGSGGFLGLLLEM